MRYLTVLLAAVFVAACSAAPAARGGSQTVATASDSIVEFLVTAAATDFHTHRPPDPARFRNVRIGHVMTPSRQEQYMLCGQFQAAQDEANAEWTPFATIKTSGYE